jgi:NAD(P)-dependent dehydrogenase (short-subunit alcohol dehydrogenase family)
MDRSRTTVLITGATDGVGRLVARRLAASGARVLAHGRSDVKGRDTLRELQREASQSHVEYFRADLASLDEVRRLANEVAYPGFRPRPTMLGDSSRETEPRYDTVLTTGLPKCLFASTSRSTRTSTSV